MAWKIFWRYYLKNELQLHIRCARNHSSSVLHDYMHKCFILVHQWFSLAWLIEYLGISITRSCLATIAWQDKRDCGFRPQARSSISSSFSSGAFRLWKPSFTITWQVVQAHTISQACSMGMSFSNKASQIEVPGATSTTAPSGQYSLCGSTTIWVMILFYWVQFEFIFKSQQHFYQTRLSEC